MKKLLFIMIPLFLCTQGRAQSFSNGDFQNGTNPWVVNGAQHANYGINGDPATNYYFDVTPNGGSGNGASVDQKVGFKISCNYTISFQIRPGGPQTSSKTAGIRVEMDGKVIAPGRFTSNNWKAWTTVTTNPVYIPAGTHSFKFIGDNGENETPQVMGLDNISIKKMESCSIDTGSSFGCCPGKNLICNGGFEDAKACFESQYQPKGKGGFKPGSYTIINYESASQLCKSWAFNNAPCQRTGNALFVNGNTNGQGSKVIWRETVSFNAWKQYRFCADVFALNQCCLNVSPKITMTLTYTSGGQTKTILLDKATADDACNWSKYTKYIAPWEGNDGGTATVSISLDETGIGDGNDFVVDNISLRELQPIDKSITNNVSLSENAGTHIFTGSFTGTLPSEAGFGWYIVPLDVNGQPDTNCPQVNNPQQWWSATTTFPGFDGCKLNTNSTAAGKFTPGKKYKVVFGTFGFCYAWDAVVFNVAVDPATQKVIITKDAEIGANDPLYKIRKLTYEEIRDLGRPKEK